MLRLTELRLPLGHAEGALRAAIVARLGVGDVDLLQFTVFRRAYDARKKTAIQLIYTVDCEVADEPSLLARRAGDAHVRPAPDTSYRLIARAPAGYVGAGRLRPLVVGFGPCGMFAALILAQMGLRAHRARARQGGARAHPGHLGPVAPWRAEPESNVQFGEGGAGTFSDGKL